MKTKLTLNDLFLYHYNELSYANSQAMEALIASDSVFEAESKRVIEMKTTLNGTKYNPSESSIRFILDYDKKSFGELAY